MKTFLGRYKVRGGSMIGMLLIYLCVGVHPAIAQTNADSLFFTPEQTIAVDSGTFIDASVDTSNIAFVSSDTTEQVAFKPDSNKALWYAALCPGLGQLYNRRYWKLPIVTAGIVGVAYAISWNGRYYTAYTNAYRDIIDNDPTTNYYESILPAGYTYSTSQLTSVLKNRQQTFRRQRDLSIIAGVAWYLLCMLDAYVDAELFDFSISDDLSIQLENIQPIQPLSPSFGGYGGSFQGMNISCSFRF